MGNISIPFIKPVQDLFGRLPKEEKAGNITHLVITSDKGLCGGVNSQVAKIARLGTLEEEGKGNTAKLLVVGNKGLGALKRVFGDRINYSFEECAKVPWTFTAASIIAEQLLATSPARVKICTNKFKSLVSYDTASTELFWNPQLASSHRE